jgi:hypothetical protein
VADRHSRLVKDKRASRSLVTLIYPSPEALLHAAPMTLFSERRVVSSTLQHGSARPPPIVARSTSDTNIRGVMVR